MLDYLINYGIKRHSIEYQDLDVVDKQALQDQINEVRRNYSTLLSLFDNIQYKYLDCVNRMSKRSKELINENDGVRSNALFSQDDEYSALDAEQQALKAGMGMINSQIEYCKSDLRILNSVFYNKF